MKTIIIDNYDSFTFNLYQYVGGIDEAPLVFRNNEVTADEIGVQDPDRIIISPGPGSPDDPKYFGVCRDVILKFGPKVPILGVCLGHQGIISAFGGNVVRASKPMHGKTSEVHHDGRGLFSGLPGSIVVMRYHSLIGEIACLPSCLEVTATTSDGELMGVRHRNYPIHGVQFHPESICTDTGKTILMNFMSRECVAPAVTFDGDVQNVRRAGRGCI
jgi:anthranilate synthase component II